MILLKTMGFKKIMMFQKNNNVFQKNHDFSKQSKKITIFHKEIMIYQNIKEIMIFHENYRYEKTHVSRLKSKTCLRFENKNIFNLLSYILGITKTR